MPLVSVICVLLLSVLNGNGAIQYSEYGIIALACCISLIPIAIGVFALFHRE
jgi:hypothetical protein